MFSWLKTKSINCSARGPRRAKPSKQCLVFLLTVLLLSSYSWAAESLLIKALFKDNAIVEVDGKQERLRVGETISGVTLLSADSKQAVVEVDGQRKTLTVGRRIGAQYRAPEKTTVRIASQGGGHYFTPGRINKRPVTFLVDTGATTIAMNSLVAQQLGIDYKSGKRHRVQTASGTETAYRVTLQSAAVGALTINNVEASVLEGAFPAQILLGNSYLSRVDLQVDEGVLVLQAKF